MKNIDHFNSMVSEVFGIQSSEITDDKTPDDIENWTSVSHMDLMAQFEDEWGVEFDVEELTEMDSIGKMKLALKDHGVEI